MADFHEPLADRLDQAAQTAQTGSLSQALSMIHDAKQEWEDHWGRVAVLADHNPMDEIDGLFAQLEQYAIAGDVSNFSACCGYLRSLISATAEAHALRWHNLF